MKTFQLWKGKPSTYGHRLAAAAAKSLQSCPTLFNSTDDSPPDLVSDKIGNEIQLPPAQIKAHSDKFIRQRQY